MSQHVEINLMGRSFTIMTDEDPDQVTAAANLVQEHIDEIRQMGVTVGSDRLLTLVALNLAGELLKGNEAKVDGLDGLLSALDGVVSQAEGLAKAPLR
ncbi:cell division protein ZapA [Mariprofundus aestuarium]|uniref:Cell division protein ZapA n=1 Tax=Mariprofundus aestuarium TaxID=1921086 RepID=A0A2K8L0F9_MARES|nr:cell division protein ZapA [Mariprofundus aestuarium]ATX80768.1 cell division protein ZapA [Mariprofundus aestuarium]